MALKIKAHPSKFISNQNVAVINNAVYVAMNEVIFDDTKTSKLFSTDALATCIAIAFCSKEPGFTTAFTHMSSAKTVHDDLRKEIILNQMLKFVLHSLSNSKIQLIISPSTIPEPYLIHFILDWANKKGLQVQLLKGGDSAIFNIDIKGNPLMISTSLTFNNQCSGHGVVFDTSNASLATSYLEKSAHSSLFKTGVKQETLQMEHPNSKTILAY